MLPVILSSSGIVRDFIKLSGTKPCNHRLLETIQAASWFSVTASFTGAGSFFISLSVVYTSLLLSFCFCFFLVWTCHLINTTYGIFLSVSLSWEPVSSQNKNTFSLKKSTWYLFCLSCMFAVLLVSSHIFSGVNCSIIYNKCTVSKHNAQWCFTLTRTLRYVKRSLVAFGSGLVSYHNLRDTQGRAGPLEIT